MNEVPKVASWHSPRQKKFTANAFSGIEGCDRVVGGPWAETGVEDLLIAGLMRFTTEPSIDSDSAVRSTTVRPALDWNSCWPFVGKNFCGFRTILRWDVAILSSSVPCFNDMSQKLWLNFRQIWFFRYTFPHPLSMCYLWFCIFWI